MFSNVNEVVEQIRLATLDGYRFQIDWRLSVYRDPNRPEDPWEYYFHPCFESKRTDPPLAKLPALLGGVKVACSTDKIITPRPIDGNCNPLLLPKDRPGAARIIAERLHLKAEILDKIDSFAAANFHGSLIGLHIRGPGRVDGGVPAMRRALNASGKAFVAPFFEAVDRALTQQPNARIFACSDALAVMRAITDRYGDRVLTWPATRSEFGEMHVSHPMNAGQEFSGFELGLDVIVEAWLLARTSWLVHGSSNVTNFVLCLNPNLPHTYIPA
jgi:hypothetical protein